MKIVIATDSFKGSLTSNEVASIIESEFRDQFADLKVTKLSIADGGEGTVDSVINTIGGKLVKKKVKGPLSSYVDAYYGLSKDSSVAYIEVASSSGLLLVAADQRDPLKTSTYGFGELIIDALDKGSKKIVLGLGGSATNDGGTGMAEALGVKFYNARGELIENLRGEALGDISRIDISSIDQRIADTEFVVASDVKNPLLGKEGATFIYGPQKGASPEMMSLLEAHMNNYNQVVLRDFNIDLANKKGAGAAGGLGYGTMLFLNAEMKSGIELLLDIIDFDQHIENADFVITGEGKIDAQSIYGKAPFGVLRRCKRNDIDVYAIAGQAENTEHLLELGFKKVYSVVPSVATLEESLNNPEENLRKLVRRIVDELKGALQVY